MDVHESLLRLYETTPLTRSILFFFNDTATTEIYTLSLHDALPISGEPPECQTPCVHCLTQATLRPCHTFLCFSFHIFCFLYSVSLSSQKKKKKKNPPPNFPPPQQPHTTPFLLFLLPPLPLLRPPPPTSPH